jgi:hypothetical protein
VFLGRVVEEGEPDWLPDDRDVVDMYFAEQKSRHACGHWSWQYDDLDGLEVGYQVCPMCAELGPYEDKIRDQNRSRGEDLHGLTFGWYPPREENDGD